jgi:malonate transporter
VIAAASIVLPLFALMLCGYLSARLDLIGKEGVRGLTTFIFYFAIPALLFRGIVNSQPAEHDQLAIVYAYFLAAFIVFFAAMAAGRLIFRLPLAEMAVMGFTATFSNTVLLGVPLIYTALGEKSVLPVTLITSLHTILLMPLATVIVELGRGGRGNLRRMLPPILAGFVRNPLFVAIVLGFAVRFAGWQLPQAVDGFLALLTGAAPPTSLFALGATLAAFHIAGRLKETALIVVIKLLIHPALAWFLCAEVFALAPIQTAVATMLAALPSGQNSFILAQQYGVHLDRTASAIVLSTALAVVTAALLVAHYAPLR